jgi:hypothetical protein
VPSRLDSPRYAARVAQLKKLPPRAVLERLLGRAEVLGVPEVDALGRRFSDAFAVRTLATAMVDRRRPARAARAGTLWFMCTLNTGRSPSRRRRVARQTLLLMQEPRLSLWMRSQVIEHAGNMPLPREPRPAWARELVEALGRVLHADPNPDLRADAVHALGNMGGRRARALLRAAEGDRAEFWGGRVGAYARWAGAGLGRGGERRRGFRWVKRSSAWYEARARGVGCGPPRARMPAARGARR